MTADEMRAMAEKIASEFMKFKNHGLENRITSALSDAYEKGREDGKKESRCPDVYDFAWNEAIEEAVKLVEKDWCDGTIAESIGKLKK